MKFTILRNETGDAGGGGGTPAPAGGAGAPGTTAPAAAGAPAGTLLSPPSTAAPAGSPTPGQAPGTPQGAFDFRKVVGDDGNFVEGFQKLLPEDLKWLDKYRSPLQAFEGHRNAEKLLGAKSNAVVIPAPDAPKEEWAPVLKKLGVPDSPDGYGLKAPDKLPEGVTVSKEELGEYAKTFHELGLTPQQANQLLKADVERKASLAEGTKATVQRVQAEAFEAEKGKLLKAWGDPESKGYKENYERAGRAALLAGFTKDDFEGRGANSGLLNNAFFLQAMATIGSKMGEDTLVRASADAGFNNPGIEANKIVTDKSHPLHALYMNGDPETVQKVQDLYKLAG